MDVRLRLPQLTESLRRAVSACPAGSIKDDATCTARSTSGASKSLVLLAIGAVLLSFFFALGRSPLFDVDEGAFSQATMEMYERGDFLSTYLNGRPYYDKPIPMFWLQAASVRL